MQINRCNKNLDSTKTLNKSKQFSEKLPKNWSRYNKLLEINDFASTYID